MFNITYNTRNIRCSNPIHHVPDYANTVPLNQQYTIPATRATLNDSTCVPPICIGMQRVGSGTARDLSTSKVSVYLVVALADDGGLSVGQQHSNL